MSKIIKKNHKGIEYWIKGKNPKLLIHSGTHGDEYGVIEHVKEYVQNHDLPDFIYVPEVSPSAVKRKTRKNARNIDLNRSFKKGAKDPEVIANMEIAQKYDIEKLITFHEDWEFDYYYFYHCAHTPSNEILIEMRRALYEKGYEGFNGIDAPDDPTLMNRVVDGYVYVPASKVDDKVGTFENWGIFNNIFKKYVNPEVPMYYDREQKKEVVHTMLNYLMQG